MAKTQILWYSINLTSKSLVDTLNAQLDAASQFTPNGPESFSGNGLSVTPIIYSAAAPNGLNLAPDSAAVWGGQLQVPATGALGLITLYDPQVSPSVSGEWFVTPANYPRNVATFTRKSGGLFGISSLFGTTTKFYWAARFRFVPSATAVTQPDGTVVPIPAVPEPVLGPAPIPARYWLETFNLPKLGNGGRGSAANPLTPLGLANRSAARHTGNMGLSHRGTQAGVPFVLGHEPWHYLPGGIGASPASSWERFYITIRAYPTTVQGIWDINNDSAAGVCLGMSPTGNLLFAFRDTGFGIQGTGPQLALNQRYKIDCLNEAGATGRWRVYVNGVIAYNSGFVVGGLGQVFTTQLRGSSFDVTARSVLTEDAAFDFDVDYWHSAAIPNISGTESLTSIDWYQGSRAVWVPPSADAGDFANWTAGRAKYLGNRGGMRTDVQVVSTTALAVASYATDLTEFAAVTGAAGIASIVVGAFGYPGTNPGSLGYAVNGGATVYTALTETGTPADPWWSTVLYTGPGTTLPLALTALAIKYKKGNDVVQAGLEQMGACVELVGFFDACDVTAGTTDQFPPNNVHNSAYPSGPWANPPAAAVPTFGPVAVFAGTYIGNGTAQDIALKAAPCFVYIRRVTGTNDEGTWWSTAMLANHQDISQVYTPTVRCLANSAFVPGGAEDNQEFEFLLRIASTSAQVNTAAQTYQYLAICDPSARYFLAEALAHGDTQTAARALARADFTPQFAFLWLGKYVQTGPSTRFYVKDNGTTITANAVLEFLANAETADALTFGAGQITVRPGLITATQEDSLDMFLCRTDDGNGPPSVPAYATASWTGDGAASRIVSIALGGKRPVWACVGGNSAYERDASHTGTNSTNLWSWDEDANGITAGGVDQLSVGANLNVAGRPYVLFVLPGSVTAGNNGWSINGEFWPIEPDSRKPTDWFEPVVSDVTETSSASLVDEPDLEDTVIIGTSGYNIGGLNGGQVCEVYTRSLVNIALSRIGVSKAIVNLATDTTEEAVLARRHVKEDINAVLRDFPWPFATLYATLLLVEGTSTVPVNNDWQYSYRAPSAMMFGRRLTVNGVGRVYDLKPSTWRIGFDATGPLIYTNVANDVDPLVLEYTTRNECPAFFGDARFREALTWKFASSLAPPLSRDPKRGPFCLQMYAITISGAQVDASNEAQPEDDGNANWTLGR